MLKHIHITGAAGAGSTTLGLELARLIDVECFDVDDFMWLPSWPPYQERRSVTNRIELLNNALRADSNWVLTGSIVGWGDLFIPRFTLVVFLTVPTDVRLHRLRQREEARFGLTIAPGGEMHQRHLAFLRLAASYDVGGLHGSRSRARHEAWLTRVPGEVLRLDGTIATSELVNIIKAALRAQR